HAAGDEHRSRRVPLDRARQLRPPRPLAPRDDGAHVRRGPSHRPRPGAGGGRRRSRRSDGEAPRRPSRRPRDRLGGGAAGRRPRGADGLLLPASVRTDRSVRRHGRGPAACRGPCGAGGRVAGRAVRPRIRLRRWVGPQGVRVMGRLVAPLVGAVPFCLAAVACGLLRRDALLERAGRVVAGRRVSRHGIAGAAVGRALAVPAGLALGALVASWPGALAGGAAAVAAPVLRRRRREAADRELVETQLIDAVSAVSAGLRAGLSLALAIRAAADEGEPPLAPSLRELVDRTSLGVSFEESLDRWADSMPSEEVRLVAGILGLHRRTGGNAPAVLDQAARTLRERHEAARELRSLTAQARL